MNDIEFEFANFQGNVFHSFSISITFPSSSSTIQNEKKNIAIEWKKFSDETFTSFF